MSRPFVVPDDGGGSVPAARRLIDIGLVGGIAPATPAVNVDARSPTLGSRLQAPPPAHNYWGMLWRQKLTITMIVIAALAVSLGAVVVQHPYYQATSELLLPEQSAQTVAGASVSPVAVDPARVLATEIDVINGPDVRAAVLAKLGQAPKISATALPDADVIRITARSDRARQAAAVANAYAAAYLDLRRARAADAARAAGTDIQQEIDSLQSQIDKSTGAQQQALIQAQAVFRQNLGQLRVNGEAAPAGRLLASATPPGSPAGPKPIRAAFWGVLLGLVVGAGVAFLRDYLDDSVSSKEGLVAAVAGLPVLGVIPIGSWKGDEPRLVSLTDPSSSVTESYRTLRTAIQFLDVDHPIRVLQITSPSTQEGKSTTVANLGVELAQAGQRVIIVCCDLRRPRIHEFFGLSNAVGLSSVLTARTSLGDALQRVPDQPGIFVLAAGPLPPNPAELLSSLRASQILDALRGQADIVLLDCPPVLPVSDSLVVSAWADATLLVCYAGRTTQKSLARSVELLLQVRAPLSGSILNAAPANSLYGEAYGYGYYSET